MYSVSDITINKEINHTDCSCYQENKILPSKMAWPLQQMLGLTLQELQERREK